MAEARDDVDTPGNDWEGRVAAAWERNRQFVFETHRHVSEALVRAVDPQPGETVLELAAGPGETGFIVADRVGQTGRLISTDLQPDMVAAARRGAEARGLGNVETRVMNAQEMDLPDGSVDAVMCRFGLMLMPDPPRVAAEARRVLRPQGRFAYAVFGAPDNNQWITLLGAAIAGAGGSLDSDPFGPGGIFSLSSPDRNRGMLSEAGFAEIDVEELVGNMHFDTLDEYWNVQTSMSGRFATVLGSMTDEELNTARSTLEEVAEPHSGDGGYDLPTYVLVVSGR